jgi:hypothetical protein
MRGSSGEMDDLLTYTHCQEEVSSCTSLQFYQAGLTSTIPTTIGLLTALTNLVLQFNALRVRAGSTSPSLPAFSPLPPARGACPDAHLARCSAHRARCRRSWVC